MLFRSANFVHRQLRSELEEYIKSQYFGKSPLLLSAISPQLDDEGLLYQKPFIESSPAYKSQYHGIQQTDLPGWMKEYFEKLAKAGIGVHESPFLHQIRALETAVDGKDLFVATGVLVKQSVLCGRLWRNLQMRPAILRLPGGCVVSERLLCIP